jgi:hypothetical protein
MAGTPLGFILYAGVRIGSLSPVKIKGEQWNHGWQDGRKPYAPLSVPDAEIVSRVLSDNPPTEVSPRERDAFLARLRSRARDYSSRTGNCSKMHSEIRP